MKILSLIPVFSGFFVWMWLNTYDMGYMVSPYMCLMSIAGIAIVLSQIEKYISPKLQNYWKFSIVPVSLLLIGTKFLFTSEYQYFFTENSIKQGIIYQEGWYAAADWIKNNTPNLEHPTNMQLSDNEWSGGNISYGEGDYGIICAWDFGNIINQRANRIPVWSRWPAAKVPKWMISQTEEASLRNLCPDCEDHEKVKYAIVDAKSAGSYFSSKANTAGLQLSAYNTQRQTNYGGRTITLFTFGNAFSNSIVNRLYTNDGTDLSHYRQVWDSPQKGFTAFKSDGNGFERYDREINTTEELNYFSQNVETLGDGTGQNVFYEGYVGPWVKIFEVVEGARIQGDYLPNAQLRTVLELNSQSSNRSFTYSKTFSCDESGKFSFIVPYSTNPSISGSAISAMGSYQILSGHTEIASFSVTEEDVIEGKGISIELK